EVNGILAAFLPGEAGGGAAFDILSGAVNPSGKLAETFPERLCDTPAFLTFPGEGNYSFYGEGLFVGYRYYDKKRVNPLFCFGHGLSYTDFVYSALHVNKTSFLDNEDVYVDINISAAGKMAGKEVVQIYIAPDEQTAAKGVIRPIKELKAFKKIQLSPGETKTLNFRLSYRDFAYYDAENKSWRVRSGKYTILAGSSSRDIRSETSIEITSTFIEKKLITRDTLLSDMAASEAGKKVLNDLLMSVNTKMRDKAGDKAGDDEAYMKMVLSMPIKVLILVGVPAEQIDGIINKLNETQA
ncbi:MAG: fibronectin type III-like domain-contianing protein, partial [Spirochaetales bacterium]|nr:fibronectin type III-like domain-contianing protein [Spirochaetales bacterium]